MDTKSTAPATIDEYIALFPDDIQAILQKVRATIQKAAPKATEKISYRMPAFFLSGNLVYFAAFKKHIGLYPPAPHNKDDAKYQAAITRYAGPKGNLQFPLSEPIPYALIAQIVKLRVKENMAKAKKP